MLTNEHTSIENRGILSKTARNARVFYWVLYSCVFVLFLIVPSVDSPSLAQSTISAKTLFFGYFMLATSTIFLLQILLSRSAASFKLSNLDVGVFLTISFIFINRHFLHVNHGFSFRYMDLFGLLCLFIILRRFKIRAFFWLSLVITLSGIAQAILGCLQVLSYYPHMNSGFNITGSYFNSGPYSGFLAIVFSVAFGTFLFRNKIILFVLNGEINNKSARHKLTMILFKYVPLVGLIIITLVLSITLSRAAWIAAATCIAFLLVNRFDLKKKVLSLNRTKKIIFFAISSVLFLGIIVGLYNFKKTSADGRLLVWKVSTNIINDHPLIGVGFDRFKTYYMDAQANYFRVAQGTKETMISDNTYYAFNETLQFTVENGILGLVLLSITAFMVIQTRSLDKSAYIKLWGHGILLTAFVFSLFSYPAQILPIKIIVVYALALMANIDSRKRFFLLPDKRKRNFEPIRWMSKPAVLIIMAILIWSSHRYLAIAKQGLKDWKIAMNSYNYGMYVESLGGFEKAWPALRNEGDFLMNYGKALSMAKQPKKALKVLKRSKNYLNNTIIETTLGDVHKVLGNYEKAERAYLHAAYMVPNRFYPHYLLAKLYEESGQTSKARKKAKEILMKEIKIPSKAIMEMKVEMRKILRTSHDQHTKS